MLHISMPCKIRPKSGVIELSVVPLDMVVEGKDMKSAIANLEAKLQKSLEVNIELEVEQIEGDRYLLISNYGEILRDLVWEISPEITTQSNARSQRVKDGHLKSTN